MSSLRYHGSVQPYGNEFVIQIEIAGCTTRDEAQRINNELCAVISVYFEQVRGGTPIDSGTGTPPWKTKQ